jgi:3-phenylpropionate/trans-cinnamate dioxygenase ferredoxin reductase subunit
VLGREIGLVFRDLHADNGVDLRLGVGVSAASGAGRVEQVTLTDGTVIATELVVVGVGVVPRTELVGGAGLALDDGLVVDQTLTTSDPRILAAGDVANAWHPLLQRQLRVEHWANARNQGATAGRSLLGAGEAYQRLPYFFSDPYDLGMEHCGHADSGDDVVIRGSVASREFIAFWLRDHHVIAGMNVNVWDVVDDIRSLIRSGVRVDPARLTDPEIALVDLTAAVAQPVVTRRTNRYDPAEFDRTATPMHRSPNHRGQIRSTTGRSDRWPTPWARSPVSGGSLARPPTPTEVRAAGSAWP